NTLGRILSARDAVAREKKFRRSVLSPDAAASDDGAVSAPPAPTAAALPVPDLTLVPDDRRCLPGCRPLAPPAAPSWTVAPQHRTCAITTSRRSSSRGRPGGAGRRSSTTGSSPPSSDSAARKIHPTSKTR
ncbi:unnamed protein product, partial [Urochloa humidicola]